MWVSAADDAALSARVAIMLSKGEKERPEETSSLAIGETGFGVIWVKGFRATEDGSLNLEGAWEIVAPNGKPLPIETATLGATNTAEAGPNGVLLRPVPAWRLPPSDPSGSYRVRVTVTDTVSHATAKAEAPFYVFLTTGGKTQITAPTENAPMALDTTLLAPGFWSMSVDDFAGSTWIHQFAWQSEDQTEARSTAPKLTFMDQPLAEAKIRFAGGRPSEVNLSFYNRGDRGVISNTQFTNLTAMVTARLKTLAGRAPQDLTPRTGNSAATKQTILVWKREPSILRLEYAWSTPKQEGASRRTFLPEYVNMTLMPATNNLSKSVMAGTQAAKTSTAALSRNVTRLPNGDVYIDKIPMVDQGEKGYCAAAAAERILSYYGTDTDQHELAQRMLMQTGGGASFESLIKGLRAIAHTLNVQVKMHMDQDARAFERMIDDYNKEARKAHAELIDPRRRDTAHTNIWSQFDTALFLKSRLKERVSMEKFFKIVQTKVEAGIPLCQCCVVGILPEEAQIGQAPGGHLRLIIGYNLKTREVLYSDSWGAGHERKRMDVGQAFAITTGLFTLEPM
jgi:ribonuclease HI